MESYDKLLLQNKAWAAEQIEHDPEYFVRLSKLQAPEFLWIGCSDSRVPANQITGTLPGEMFVHRNIANVVFEDDLNLLNVLYFAVKYLKIKHIILCGHYGCGGVRAAITDDDRRLDKWLANIKRVYREHRTEIDALPTEAERVDRLSELSVMQQVKNLTNIPIIQEAWKNEDRPALHGWVYGLKDGLIKPLVEVDPVAQRAMD
jgi:carbonic anhydrase